MTPDRDLEPFQLSERPNLRTLLCRLVDTGNLAASYSDSQLSFWLKDRSPGKTAEAVALVKQIDIMPTLLQALGQQVTTPLDGKAYNLPKP